MTLYDYLIALKIKIYLTYRFLNSVKNVKNIVRMRKVVSTGDGKNVGKKCYLYVLSFARGENMAS